MTLTLLHHWGLHRCEDVGAIVFHLVDKQVLGKTDQDSRSDFAGGYSFEDAFQRPFLPAEPPGTASQA